MPSVPPLCRRSTAAWTSLLLLVLIGVLAGLWATWPSLPPVPAAPRLQPTVPAAVPVLIADAPAALGGTDAPARADATPPPPVERTFAQYVDDLVRLGMRTAEAASADDIEAAKAADRQARATLSELLAKFPDAGERAVHLLAEQPDAAEELAIRGRCVVLQLVLDEELARRRALAEADGDRTRLDALVQSVLDVMPIGTRAAEVGDRALHERPFLRAAHEPTVLQYVRLAGEQRFPRTIATHLLLTLWTNLRQLGERTSDELSALALSLLGDGDAMQRLAACRQLLSDPRHRALVLQWLRERTDRDVAAELAALAARELPPAEALAVLRELAAVVPQAPNAYLTLGFRSPETLADGYRELLAADLQPAVRKDLVTGIGLGGTPLGLEIAQLALANDPSPDVRIQAVFALTSRAAPEVAERAIDQLLDDPQVARDPSRLGSLVIALQNFEAGGHANVIDRLAQRLRATPLAEHSRQLLDALVQRGLPGGRTSVAGPVEAPR